MRPQRPQFMQEALATVGRNLVNFQRLERCLKAVASLAPITATSQTIDSSVAKRAAAIERFTLGAAVNAWVRGIPEKKLYSDGRSSNDEITISFGIGLDVSQEAFASHTNDLVVLVVERNKLVHQDLAAIDFDNEAECLKLIEQLDAQNVRIIRSLEGLSKILSEVREIISWLASEEGQNHFINDLQLNRNESET